MWVCVDVCVSECKEKNSMMIFKQVPTECLPIVFMVWKKNIAVSDFTVIIWLVDGRYL